MKLIAKIAIPLVIVASLAGCSSSSNEEEIAPHLSSSIFEDSDKCIWTPSQLAEDKKDQAEIELIREAVRTGKPTADMIEHDVTIEQAELMLKLYDNSMKKC